MHGDRIAPHSSQQHGHAGQLADRGRGNGVLLLPEVARFIETAGTASLMPI